jgi:hypothetical protein
MLRKASAENKHPRFMMEFSFHDPYGKSKFYKKAVETAGFGKLTKLIGICAMLLQTMHACMHACMPYARDSYCNGAFLTLVKNI